MPQYLPVGKPLTYLPSSSHSQVKAVEESQKYKEGKFILEKALLEKLAEVA
jgi:hypothetical protein